MLWKVPLRKPSRLGPGSDIAVTLAENDGVLEEQPHAP
jgi:hypothetical protein